MTDFERIGFVSSLIESFEKGLDIDEFSVALGGSDYDRLDYPIAQFYPDQINYNGEQEYTDTHSVFLIFEQDVNKSQIKRNSELMEKVLDSLMQELGENNLAIEFKPQNIRYMVGNNQGGLLDVIEIDVEVKKVVRFQ